MGTRNKKITREKALVDCTNLLAGYIDSVSYIDITTAKCGKDENDWVLTIYVRITEEDDGARSFWMTMSSYNQVMAQMKDYIEDNIKKEV